MALSSVPSHPTVWLWCAPPSVSFLAVQGRHICRFHVPTRSTPPLPNTAWSGPHPGPIPLNFFSNPFKTKLLRETFHTLFFISDETVVGLEPGTLLHLQDKAAEEVPRTPAQAAALWQLGWHYSLDTCNPRGLITNLYTLGR